MEATQKPVTEYQAIETMSIDDLNEEIQKMINAGWRCQGGISIALDSEDTVNYAQAMVK